MRTIAPGSTIGIIGGGQLGRMLAMAAAQLGYRVHILDPDPECCAGEVAAKLIVAGYDDRTALAAFADSVDVATYEFENVDAGPLEEVAARTPVFPPLSALRIAQDRVSEKSFAAQHGGTPATWAAVENAAALGAALAAVGTPAILKTTRFGYDGKGQARLSDPAESEAGWTAIDGGPAILEAMVPFAHEFSVLIARGQDGATVLWDSAENVHVDGILATSTVPPHRDIAAQLPGARALAERIAAALDYVGVLAIEFFAAADGPVFNEMAPRVHNSGHWTTEGAFTSQFENHIRAICGLPLGDTALVTAGVEMTNLIGDDVAAWPELMAERGAHVHLYGKGEARPGRKMGHITRLR
ncbi:5-(carboxyamino)imidazole ribonucleotide synthase [Sphingomonas sp. SUN039]|uniref:5-(carboxyamino)imidazole ribonucleotide synthase n=1 Tax=Sphingomonas sp. SUN039 TaxID=2937787 RepID=UPI002164A39A|nr:5-(carboxyamino)imidazole ribonucleotide synthase [Sphingomonas sp. SUN039]UVO55523.1 5-(carboxyamino)imidazole ribonucleotide synthase [Sphingomonas sp. SUN039]